MIQAGDIFIVMKRTDARWWQFWREKWRPTICRVVSWDDADPNKETFTINFDGDEHEVREIVV